MPLSEKEQEQLDKLLAKSKEPETPSGGGNGNGRNEAVQIVIDLSDKEAVERAVAFGLLTESDLIQGKDDLEDDPPDDSDLEDDDDPKKKTAAQRKRGYFKGDAE